MWRPHEKEIELIREALRQQGERILRLESLLMQLPKPESSPYHALPSEEEIEQRVEEEILNRRSYVDEHGVRSVSVKPGTDLPQKEKLPNPIVLPSAISNKEDEELLEKVQNDFTSLRALMGKDTDNAA